MLLRPDPRPPKWLSTDLILSQFGGDQDRHKSYREKVKKYASEEKRLFEDLRHRLILGSKQFVEKIRKRYTPAKPEVSLPQQKQVAKAFDPITYVRRAEEIFECDIAHFVHKKGYPERKRKSEIYFSMVSGKPVNLKMNKSAICLG